MLQAEAFRDTVDRFVALGLDADVAETYLHVLTCGALRPGGLATVLRISRADAYRRLERLAALGMATSSGHRPIAYEPAEPATVFQLLHRDAAAKAKDVKAAMSELEPYIRAFSGWSAGMEGRTFRYLAGRGAHDAEVHRILDHAKKEVLIVNTHPRGVELADRAGLWDRLRRCHEDGLQWRAVLADSPDARRRAASEPIRVLRTENVLRFLIADREIVLLCITNDASGARDAPLENHLLTGAPGFLAARMAFFECLWSQGSRTQSHGWPGAWRDPPLPVEKGSSTVGDLSS